MENNWRIRMLVKWKSW